MNVWYRRVPFSSAGWAAAGVVLLLAACQTTPKPGGPGRAGYVFFPPPPDEPRIQFLTSYSSELDLRGREGTFTRFLVGKDAPARPLVKPYGLALSHNQLYVCDSSLASLEIFDLAERKLRYFSPSGQGRLNTPINVTVDSLGTRYVTDAGTARVILFAPNDTCLGVIQEEATNAPPTSRNQTLAERRKNFFWLPLDVAVSADRIYVADMKGQMVRVYNKTDHKPLFVFPDGPDRQDENKKLFQPTNLALDPEGNVYVSDTAGFRVQKYDPNGKYLRTIGTTGIGLGQFARPKGIAVDRANRLYVVDAVSQVVQVFDAEGHLLMFFGEPGNGTPVELNLPAKVMIDYDHVGLFQRLAAPGFTLEYLVFVTNQYGDRKVAVFGFGRKQTQ